MNKQIVMAILIYSILSVPEESCRCSDDCAGIRNRCIREKDGECQCRVNNNILDNIRMAFRNLQCAKIGDNCYIDVGPRCCAGSICINGQCNKDSIDAGIFSGIVQTGVNTSAMHSKRAMDSSSGQGDNLRHCRSHSDCHENFSCSSSIFKVCLPDALIKPRVA